MKCKLSTGNIATLPREMRLCVVTIALFLGFLAIAVTQGAGEAAEYPLHPIHVIVPWPAGGPTDAVARVLAQEISNTLKQAVIVDNKPGASGTIGSDAAAKSDHDGYTLVVANTATHALAKIATPNSLTTRWSIFDRSSNTATIPSPSCPLARCQ